MLHHEAVEAKHVLRPSLYVVWNCEVGNPNDPVFQTDGISPSLWFQKPREMKTRFWLLVGRRISSHCAVPAR